MKTFLFVLLMWPMLPRTLTAESPSNPNPAPPLADEETSWVMEFDLAVEIAKKNNKDLFIDFTGSDWCTWCIRLDKEVFKHETFLDAVQDDFVLVKLDFPSLDEGKKKVPNPKRNREVARQYGITGFPTILLMTADGDVYAETGYQKGGPENYIRHLTQIRGKGRAALDEVLDLVKEFEAAAAETKMTVWEKAVSKLGRVGFSTPGMGKLTQVVKVVFSMDPENEKGLKERAVRALLDARQFDKAIAKAVRDLDPNNEKGLFERLVLAQSEAVTHIDAANATRKSIEELDATGKIHDKRLVFRLYVNFAHWSKRFFRDAEGAKKYAQKARDLDIDNMDPKAEAFLERILGPG